MQRSACDRRVTRVGVVVLAALCAGSIAACTATRLTRTLKGPAEVGTLDRRSPYLKVHARNGHLYVLTAWTVEESSGTISGDGEHLDVARQPLSRGRFTLALPDVALVETNVVQRSPAVAALAVITGISAAVTAYCIVQPKACFGSCPTFYVGDGSAGPIQAEGFSSSVAPSLEARDVDALYKVELDTNARLTITMKNEALETHVVRSVRLLAAARPAGGRVVATLDGEFREATDPRAALACEDDGGDCARQVAAFDGQERMSVTDAGDLARRETIELRFQHGQGPQALVIASRQSLASTYLFYQSLAYLGRSAGETLASLERGDPAAHGALQRLQRVLGGIEVWSETLDGGWVLAGEVDERGPLATDVVAVPMPARTTGRVRLRMARGHWRVDYLSMMRLGAAVLPASLEPESIRDQTGASVRPGSVTTLPGDTYTYSFHLGNAAAQELFLDTQGYYLEWMREEWLREENALRAAQLLVDPEQLLRDLAPEFKKQESHMESVFWSSRYARR